MSKKISLQQSQLPGQEAATAYLDLAGEAILKGMTREHVIAQLVSRIRRDEAYLGYRRANGKRTRYDEQVTSDLLALALAAALLGDTDARG